MAFLGERAVNATLNQPLLVRDPQAVSSTLQGHSHHYRRYPWVIIDRAILPMDLWRDLHNIITAAGDRPANDGPAYIKVNGSEPTKPWVTQATYANDGHGATVSMNDLLPLSIASRVDSAGIQLAELSHENACEPPIAIGLQVVLMANGRAHNYTVHRNSNHAVWAANDSEELLWAILGKGGDNDPSLIYDPRIATPTQLNSFFDEAAARIATLLVPHLPKSPLEPPPITWRV